MPEVSRWPDGFEWRVWQDDAYATWRQSDAHNRTNFLLVAQPGSGKTLFAVRVAHDLLYRSKVDRVVIVVPTEVLRGQWTAAAHAIGLELDPKWSNGDGLENDKDFHGIVVTYATVSNKPQDFVKHCRLARTLVIFDEIHHAGTNRSWGDNITEAFGSAVRRLLLSGTPFRSDGNPMPFVRYVEGRSEADFTYSYGQAIEDTVCRVAVFPSFEGEMEWVSGTQTIRATFEEKLPDEEAAHRLRTALHANGDWLPRVVREANERLDEVRRNGHLDAGGLIVCIDQRHAKELRRIVAQVTGEEPVIVVSEDPLATEKLRAFAIGRQRWLIAVRMVSEGVDIKRLRVGVYATNIITEMYFRQFIGRFVRMIEKVEFEQVAYILIPAEATLISYAEQIKEERDHAIDQLLERAITDVVEGAERSLGESTFAPIDAQARAGDVIFDGERRPGDHFQMAEQIAAKIGGFSLLQLMALSDLVAAGEIHLGTVPAEARHEPPPAHPSRAAADDRDQLKSIRHSKVNVLAGLLQRCARWDRQTACITINNELYRSTGVWVKQASIEDLKNGIQLLRQWIEECQRAITAGLEGEWIEEWLYDGAP